MAPVIPAPRKPLVAPLTKGRKDGENLSSHPTDNQKKVVKRKTANRLVMSEILQNIEIVVVSVSAIGVRARKELAEIEYKWKVRFHRIPLVSCSSRTFSVRRNTSCEV